MFLRLSTTGPDSGVLSWLLRKHPDRHQTFPLTFGTAHVLWPVVEDQHHSCALYVDVDPIQLVRGRENSPHDGPLAQYVNDRPSSASSLLSVALNKVFRSAMGPAPADRPDLPRPYTVHLPVIPSRGGAAMLRRLFEPLGYGIELIRLPLDPEIPRWGDSNLYSLTLSIESPLASILRHLYVLIPVLDDHKHYWVGEEEVQKLLRMGKGWLETHPDREDIALRYLKRRRYLARQALEALVPDAPEEEDESDAAAAGEVALERPLTLNARRLDRVVQLLSELGVREVVDLGCGEGRLLAMLLQARHFARVIGIDVSPVALKRTERRLRLDEKPQRYTDRLSLWTGSATYRDRRLDGIEAVVLVEVIEHMELDRLPLLETALFKANRPEHVIVTTPNRSYNSLFEGLQEGRLRHSDHRFEWTRAEFEAWAQGVAERCSYAVTFEGIGPSHDEHGCPTQLALFAQERR